MSPPVLPSAVRWAGDKVWTLEGPDGEVIEVHVEPILAAVYEPGAIVEIEGRPFRLVAAYGSWAQGVWGQAATAEEIEGDVPAG